jgi:hypothetical protein
MKSVSGRACRTRLVSTRKRNRPQHEDALCNCILCQIMCLLPANIYQYRANGSDSGNLTPGSNFICFLPRLPRGSESRHTDHLLRFCEFDPKVTPSFPDRRLNLTNPIRSFQFLFWLSHASQSRLPDFSSKTVWLTVASFAPTR